jgi:hypothetical protein
MKHTINEMNGLQAAKDNDLFIKILVDAVASFSTQATLLNASKWNDGLANGASIGTHHTNFELLGDPPHAANVPGEEVPSKPNFGVVRKLDDLFFSLEFDKRGNGPECLLFVELGSLWDICKHCRQEEVVWIVGRFGRGNGRGGFATNKNLCTKSNSVVDMPLDFLNRASMNQRTMRSI